MSANEVVLTPEGAAEIEKKLEFLKTVRRPEISDQIKVARSFGDIRENSEYDEAKNEQAKIEGEITYLENMMRTAKIIDDRAIDTKTVNIGAVVSVLNVATKEKVEYHIVGSVEADPLNYKISNESPIGAALMGRKINEKVEASTPAGKIALKILNIHK